MKNSSIFYFSGTGNTQRAATIVETTLNSSGIKCAKYSILKNKNSFSKMINNESEDVDTVFIMFPVYATAVPSIMLSFLKNITKLETFKECIILCTIGQVDLKDSVPGHEGQALIEATNILTNKGFKVIHTDAISYPANLGLVTKLPGDNEISLILNNSNKKIEYITKQILTGETRVKKYKSKNIMIFFCSLFGILYKTIGRRIFGKLLVADNECISCGICVKVCPANQITYKKNLPGWRINCEGCQRCVGACPSGSIGISIARLISLIIALFFPFIFIYPAIKSYNSFLLNILIWFISNIISTFGFIYIIEFIEKIPLLSILFRYNMKINDKQYLEPEFKPLSNTNTNF